MRVCITGGPGTGKTTMAADPQYAGARVRHTDSLIDSHGWSEQSEEVSRWLDEPGPWVVEGVVVPRALRKWLARVPAPAKPCDRVVMLRNPLAQLTAGQSKMTAGIHTVWEEIRPELARRGVELDDGGGPARGEDAALALEELAEQAEEVLSPLAEYLARSSPENAAKLSALASAGLLTLNDVQAGLAQEVINMTLLAGSEEDAAKLNEMRMVRVQIQRVLKELAKVVKVGKGGGPQVQIHIQWPAEYADDRGDLTPTDRSQLAPEVLARDAQTAMPGAPAPRPAAPTVDEELEDELADIDLDDELDDEDA